MKGQQETLLLAGTGRGTQSGSGHGRAGWRRRGRPRGSPRARNARQASLGELQSCSPGSNPPWGWPQRALIFSLVSPSASFPRSAVSAPSPPFSPSSRKPLTPLSACDTREKGRGKMSKRKKPAKPAGRCLPEASVAAPLLQVSPYLEDFRDALACLTLFTAGG